MLHPTSDPTESLRLRRIFPARRERVFRAWTSPEALKAMVQPPGPRDALRRGGPADGRPLPPGNAPEAERRPLLPQRHLCRGDAPEKLVYTWWWESDPDVGETLVTVEFVPKGEATEVVLTHERFRTPEQAAQHNTGCQGCLDGMEAYLRTNPA